MKSEKYIKIINHSFVAAGMFFLFLLHLIFFIPNADAGNERTIALVMKALSNPFFFIIFFLIQTIPIYLNDATS